MQLQPIILNPICQQMLNNCKTLETFSVFKVSSLTFAFDYEGKNCT